MMIEIVLWAAILFGSLYLLMKGADVLLLNASALGKELEISSFLIGFFIIGIGTSLPEFATAIASVINDVPDIIVPMIVGSNTANILLVLGFAGVVNTGALVLSKKATVDNIPILLTSAFLFIFVAYDGSITRTETILILLISVFYLAYKFKNRGEVFDELDDTMGETKSQYPLIGVIVGIATLVLASSFAVRSVITLSEILNVGVEIFSITAIALGTSLPELIVAIRSVLSHSHTIALGTIIGSNIFNIVIIGGVSGLLVTLPLTPLMTTVGLPFMGLATLLFTASVFLKSLRTQEAIIYILLYFIFIAKMTGLI